MPGGKGTLHKSRIPGDILRESIALDCDVKGEEQALLDVVMSACENRTVWQEAIFAELPFRLTKRMRSIVMDA